VSKCFFSLVRATRTLQRLALPLVVLLASCIARGPRSQPATDQSVIHAEELEATRQNTLYEAVRIARPMWFTSRGGESAILVYQDDQAVGGAGVLRRISVFSTARVTYMAPTEAQIRFGQRNGMRPAIVVETLR
jgi:hypothetical protein